MICKIRSANRIARNAKLIELIYIPISYVDDRVTFKKKMLKTRRNEILKALNEMNSFSKQIMPRKRIKVLQKMRHPTNNKQIKPTNVNSISQT